MQLPSKEVLRPWLNRGGLALTLLILVVLAYVIGHQPKESPSLLQPVTAQTPAQDRPNPAEQRTENQQRGPDLNNPEDRHKLEEIYLQRLQQLRAMDQPPAQPKQPQDQPKQPQPKQESPPQRGLVFDLIQGTPDMLEPKVNPNIKGEMKMPERKRPGIPRRVPNEDRFDPNRPYRFRNNESPPPDRDQGGTPS